MPQLLTTVAPIQEAAKKLAGKTPVASALRTKDWEKIPAQVRERSLWSSTIEEPRFLSVTQEKLLKAIGLQREKVARGEAFVDRSSFIGDLRKVAFEQGLFTGQGGLMDPTSRARLGLIYDMQVQGAQGYATWKQDQDPDVLNMFPAQELVRLETRRMERNWRAIFEQAGGTVRDGRLVALKSDPLWTEISDFDRPWPPFKWGSGMGLRDVSRAEAIDLQLIRPDALLHPPAEKGFNMDAEVKVDQLPAGALDLMRRLLGEAVKVVGDTVRLAA